MWTFVAAQQQNPTFRSGIRLVDVDVVVTDQNGNPVRDLTQDDFEIIEDGRRQPVRTFSLIDLPFASPASLSEGRADEVEPDVTTNATPEGRTYVLLLDGATDLRARRVTEQWLDQVVQPNDRVAVVHAQGTFADAQTFTTSRRLISNSINRMLRGPGRDLRPPEVRHLDTLRAIEDIAKRLGTIAGRRKAIVWVGGDLDLHAHAEMRQGQKSDAKLLAMPLILSAWRDASRAAIDNNVAIYPVDPQGLTDALGMGELVRAATLREVAEETGGVAVGVNTNNFSRGFATIVQDASVYYLLGYSPDFEREDGKFHPIRITVKRSGLTVRARRGYYANGDAALPSVPAPSPGLSPSASDALRLPVSVRGLAVNVLTVPLKGPGTTPGDDSTSVLIVAGISGQQLSFEGRSLTVAFKVLDVEGKPAASGHTTFGLQLGETNRQRVRSSGLRFTEQIALPPGRYELRIVAEQEGGPLGSVVSPFEAPEFKEPFEMSGIVVSASGLALEVPLPRRSAAPAPAALAPTLTRAFRAEATLRVFAEIYFDQRTSPGDIVVTGTILQKSTEVLRRPAMRVAALSQNDARRIGVEAELPLRGLPPGAYVLALNGHSTSLPRRTASRQVPFTIQE